MIVWCAGKDPPRENVLFMSSERLVHPGQQLVSTLSRLVNPVPRLCQNVRTSAWRLLTSGPY